MQPSGSWTWNIRDKALIQKMLNAKNVQRFYSPTFKIAELDWQLLICPNGHTKEVPGAFDLYLKLIKMPKLWNVIMMTRTLDSPQTHTKVISMDKYIKDGQSLDGDHIHYHYQKLLTVILILYYLLYQYKYLE